MKLAPSYISKEKLIKKIAKRNQERIADYTVVSSAFKQEDSKLIKDNLDSIARYAERQKINLEFEPSSSEMGTAKMNVYRRGAKLVNLYDTMDPNNSNMMLVPATDFIGSAKLPSGLNSKSELMKSIKSNAAEMLYKQQ